MNSIVIIIILGLLTSIVGSFIGGAMLWKARHHLTRIDASITDWTVRRWRQCVTAWTATRSWSQWPQTLFQSSLPLAGMGAIVSIALYYTTGGVPTWVDVWAIASAVAIAVAGWLIFVLLIWRGSKKGAGWIHQRLV